MRMPLRSAVQPVQGQGQGQGQGQANGVVPGRYTIPGQGGFSSPATASVSGGFAGHFAEQQQQQHQRNVSSGSARGHTRIGSGSGSGGEEFGDF